MPGLSWHAQVAGFKPQFSNESRARTSGLLAQQAYDFRSDAARFVDAFLLGFTCRRVLLVDERRRVLGAEALALRLGERCERLVHQYHRRDSLFPRCKCVAHGGAGAGASGSDADHQIVD